MEKPFPSPSLYLSGLDHFCSLLTVLPTSVLASSPTAILHRNQSYPGKICQIMSLHYQKHSPNTSSCSEKIQVFLVTCKCLWPWIHLWPSLRLSAHLLLDSSHPGLSVSPYQTCSAYLRRCILSKPRPGKPRGVELFAGSVLQLSQIFLRAYQICLATERLRVQREFPFSNKVPTFTWGNAQCFSGIELDYSLDYEHQRIKKRMKFPRYTFYI